MNIYDKLERLKTILGSLSNLAVAFSGGVDSAFLLKVSHEILKENVLALTACSSNFPQREYNEAVEFVNKYGIRHMTISSEELEFEIFSQNPVDRCFYCKHEFFSKIIERAHKENIRFIADGSNLDDTNDYRPGLKALMELGVLSPLKDAFLTKDDIRQLSREMGIDIWDKPSFACLATRFPYGESITDEKLRMVDLAEQYLLDSGFKQVRVRYHGDIARIEVLADERVKFFNENLLDAVSCRFKEIGFVYTVLDLKGYRTGSMNETL